MMNQTLLLLGYFSGVGTVQQRFFNCATHTHYLHLKYTALRQNNHVPLQLTTVEKQQKASKICPTDSTNS